MGQALSTIFTCLVTELMAQIASQPRKAGCIALLSILLGCSAPSSQSTKQKCRQGQGLACLKIGQALQSGGSGHDLPDPGASLRWYRRACELNIGRGCFAAGRLVRDADGVKADAPLARRLATAGCTLRDPMACLLLATMESVGEGGAAAPQKATQRLRRLCQNRLLRACNDLALIERATSRPAAMKRLAEACEAGSALACGNLGIILCESDDVEQARPLLARACRGDVSAACIRLTSLPAVGESRHLRDFGLYQRACKLGSAAGCGGLALHLFQGLTGAPRPIEAVRIWRSLCEQQRHGPSCFNLAVAYLRGAPPALIANRAAAGAWRHRACALGVTRACPRPALKAAAEPLSTRPEPSD
ncbi:MAG TPA: hypothetical protein DCQ06_13905 [Myxococcales bacterium]|nr:hypothetical protein [Myxococcales bacterium]